LTIIPVFELRPLGKPNAKPLAGGGRYDKLLTLLGSKREIPATGFAVYVDRVTAKPKKSAKKAAAKTASKPAAKKAGVKK
jgi:ATP phosphoribosyltransferase regulatory subunit HisZ